MVIIAGVAGFIGSHLSDRLLSIGIPVLGVDNFLCGSRENLVTSLSNINFRLIRRDVSIPFTLDVDSIFTDISCVYNLSIPYANRYALESPLSVSKSSILNTCNLLGVAEYNKAKFVLASSSAIYGETPNSPVSESDVGLVDPIATDACISESMRCAESLSIDFFRHRKVDTNILRLFEVYGPRMDASSGSVIGSMISNALVGADLIIPSDESVGLNVCYVSDVVDAFVKVQSRQDLTWRVFNVAASNNIPYRTLAELIIALTGSRSKITSSFLNYKNKFTIVADISAAKTNLLWQPKIGIEEGLDKTITYFLHKRKSS